MRSIVLVAALGVWGIAAGGCQTGIGDRGSGGSGDLDAGTVDLGRAISPDGAEDGGAVGDLGFGGDLAGSAADGAVGDEQRPPAGGAALEAWLARGLYTRWRCEPTAHDARPPGAHGRNRICTNEALAGSPGPGDFPVGAASVKELWDDQGVRGYAVALRVAAGAGGERWYWYERSGASVFADGPGAGICTGCHGGAPRDFVFTVVH